jgi:enoyl-CoA hydratase/carnithine racemase
LLVSNMSGIHIHQRQGLFWLILDQHIVTAEMLERLATYIQEAIKQSPRLVVLTSAGEHAFCTGVEQHAPSSEHSKRMHSAAEKISAAFEILRTQGIETVALIKGLASEAGCELALLCDTVIAREDAQFRFPTPDTELFPSVVSAYLPTVVGQEVATSLVQRGEKLDARKAMQLGLVHQVLPSGHYLEDVQELLVMLSTVNRIVICTVAVACLA